MLYLFALLYRQKESLKEANVSLHCVDKGAKIKLIVARNNVVFPGPIFTVLLLAPNNKSWKEKPQISFGTIILRLLILFSLPAPPPLSYYVLCLRWQSSSKSHSNSDFAFLILPFLSLWLAEKGKKIVHEQIRPIFHRPTKNCVLIWFPFQQFVFIMRRNSPLIIPPSFMLPTEHNSSNYSLFKWNLDRKLPPIPI